MGKHPIRGRGGVVKGLVASHLYAHIFFTESVLLAPVVQRLDNAIHRINRYPEDSVINLSNNPAGPGFDFYGYCGHMIFHFELIL